MDESDILSGTVPSVGEVCPEPDESTLGRSELTTAAPLPIRHSAPVLVSVLFCASSLGRL